MSGATHSLSFDEKVMLASWRASTLRMGLDVFPKTFKRDRLTPARVDYCQFLDDDSIAQKTVTGYRGFMKSTGLGVHAVRKLGFRMVKFLVWVSRTQDHAVPRTESIKQALLTNRKLRQYWGSLKPIPYDGINPAFSKYTYSLADENTGQVFAVVVPKGADQTMNGLLFNIDGEEVRPDFFILDDVIDRRFVRSPKYRKQIVEFIYDHLMPCVDEVRPQVNGRWPGADKVGFRPPWQIVWADTIKAVNDPFLQIRNSADWFSRTYPKAEFRDGQWHSTIPNIVSHKQIRSEVKKAENEGRIDGWVREYACLPRWSGSKEHWHTGLYRYYREDEQHLNDDRYRRVMIVDPARTANTRSAYTAGLPIAVDEAGAKVFFRPMLHDRIGYVEQPYKILRWGFRHNTYCFAVETTGDEDGFVYRLREAAKELKEQGELSHPIEIMTLDARKYGKLAREDQQDDEDDDIYAAKRARGLESLPLYSGGHVVHEQSYKNGPLERQQLSFPDCGQWDAFDVHGYVKPVLRKLGIVMVSLVGEVAVEKRRRRDNGDEAVEAWAEEVAANAFG